MERDRRVAAVDSRVRQRADQAGELGDRARVAVADDERQGVRFGRTDVKEVDLAGRRSLSRTGERLEASSWARQSNDVRQWSAIRRR
jgi:hypothetical protein